LSPLQKFNEDQFDSIGAIRLDPLYMKIKSFIAFTIFLFSTPLTFAAGASTWSYALKLHYKNIEDSATWEGDIGSRKMTVPLDVESLGTLCARIKAKVTDLKILTLQIEWGSQARTRRENGPNAPTETRCIVRAESRQSCTLKQEKGERSSQCQLTLQNLLLSEVTPLQLGPGWTLESPRTPLQIPLIQGTFTFFPH